jgi:hypothetical protein
MSSERERAGELVDREGHSDATAAPTALTREELLAEYELLRERNQRLRDSYVRARRTQYRRAAIGLLVVGAAAVAGGAVLPGVRDVLLVLGGTGIFGGILSYYLTPERFVSADVGGAVYDALADDRAAVVDDLGLADVQVYVPVGEQPRVRLFVPQYADYELPTDDELDAPHVVADEDGARGVAFRPTGERLFRSFEDSIADSLGETPGAIASQTTEALVEQFDLVAGTQIDLDAADGRLTVGVTDSAYGPVDRIDHPVASVVAVGLAFGLDVPVTIDARQAADDRVDYRVTCRWSVAGGASVGESGDTSP